MKNKTIQILTKEIHKSTSGAGDFVNLTFELQDILDHSALNEGQMTVFNIGSTAGIVSLEYEPGLIQDMKELYEKVAPSNQAYKHDQTWNDNNGFSHARAALQGPSMTIPFKEAKLLLGSWQQIALAEFDNRPRTRRIVVQIIGI